MKFWTGLCKEADREELIEGVNIMLKVAKQILADQQQAGGLKENMDGSRLKDKDHSA